MAALLNSPSAEYDMVIPIPAGFSSIRPLNSAIKLFTTYVHCVPHIRPDSLPYKTLGFDVFKFDFINNHHLVKLSLLEDIGDRAIFLDKRRCFAFSTTQFPELRPGSIYFADGNYKWKYNFGGHDMGICNYADDRIIDQIPFPSHTWFIPDVDVDF
ncbi:hypothetical protein BC332_17056 [Capsicum chinense]|nr:hypothetical protein BC332_17056 [Capsicum chinense]